MALSMLNIGIVSLALILLRTIPWLVGRISQHTAQRKTTYVSTDQTVEQELRITAGRL
jgi:iron(III) transport system permease protein